MLNRAYPTPWLNATYAPTPTSVVHPRLRDRKATQLVGIAKNKAEFCHGAIHWLSGRTKAGESKAATAAYWVEKGPKLLLRSQVYQGRKTVEGVRNRPARR